VSRELRIEVDSAPLERARADAAAVWVFAGERPLRGGAGRADWRLCGLLSRLLAAGRLSGALGEAALVATFGGLRAPLLLVLGAGERAGFEAPRFQELCSDAVARALALRAGSLALALPEDFLGGPSQERGVAALVSGAVAAVGAAPAAVELELQALVPREEVTRTADLLRRVQPGRVPGSVALRLAAGRPRAPAAPGAVPGLPEGAPPVVK
jgi:hypothetical protein